MTFSDFKPIDLSADFDVCVRFLRDALVCSYGSTDMLEQMGGADAYLQGLEKSLADFPEGTIHIWAGRDIVGQIEMRIRPEPRIGFVNLFYLVPEQRGGPLGDKLQAYAVDVLRRHQVEKARLSVSPTNLRAMSYYTKHGWRDLGPRPDRPYVHAMELDVRLVDKA